MLPIGSQATANCYCRHTLAAAGDRSSSSPGVLRDALALGVAALQSGQIVLATMWGLGCTVCGVVGNCMGYLPCLMVWHFAVGTISRLSKLQAPVGEALIMTAVGLAGSHSCCFGL